MEERLGKKTVQILAIVIGILPYPIILFSLLTRGDPN
jgi:hypothetical protein